MDAQLLNVGILFGGKSAEHEISIQSAKNIVDALDKTKYRPVLLYIDQKGHWHRINKALLDATPGGKSIDTVSKETSIILEPQSNGIISSPQNEELAVELDVVFPILHGPMGEDGTVQGLLKLANVPFVGAGVLGSAVGMDKDVMKRLLKEADIPIGKFVCVKNTEPMPEFEWIKDRLGMPCYVKPANLGSSVGISKVATEEEFKKALELAFRFDRKILIEENIQGREIECAVLGNDFPMASIPGEVISQGKFYSYEAKYLDKNQSRVEIPAKISENQLKTIQEMAIKTFQVLCCEGLGRVDCFLTDDGRVLVNEINTLPGFTNISMYPKMWEYSGISYSELIDRLIQLSIERHKEELKLRTSYSE